MSIVALFKRKKGEKCYYVITTGEKTAKGSYRRQWIDLETTNKEEAKDKAKSIGADIVTKGKYYPPSKDTFREWLKFWLEESIKSLVETGEIEGNTYDDYECIIRLHILPELGNYQLRQITPELLESFFIKKRKEKRLIKTKGSKGKYEKSDLTISGRTLQKVHTVLNKSLDKAVKFKKIPENPNKQIERPKHKYKESTYMTAEEVLKFLETFRENKRYPLFVTALGTGLRLGELMALKWTSVDLEKMILKVEATRTTINTYAEEGNGPKTVTVTKKPKTEKSTRIVPLPVDVVLALKEWKLLQREERKKNLQNYHEQGYVFTGKYGEPLRPDSMSNRFKVLISKYGRKDMTFHKLRHSYASMLLELGEDIKTIQENLGHANLNTTANIYTHILEKIKERAARKLDGFSIRKIN